MHPNTDKPDVIVAGGGIAGDETSESGSFQTGQRALLRGGGFVGYPRSFCRSPGYSGDFRKITVGNKFWLRMGRVVSRVLNDFAT